MKIILVILTTMYITYVLKNLKFESNDEPIIKFNDSMIKIMAGCSITCIVMLLFIGFITVSTYLKDGMNDEVSNMIGVFIVIFILFFLVSLLYLFLKTKKILITENKIIHKSFLKKTFVTNIISIKKALDYPGDKIILLLDNNKIKLSYQMDNINLLKTTLKENKIEITNKTGKELW
jgi:hypothetical protein